MPFSDIIGHDTPKQNMRTALTGRMIGHAYIFAGDDGIGKRGMALALAQALSCEDPAAAADDSCGQCRSCRQILSATYPDMLIIEPEREKANPHIPIDRVRDIERHMIYQPLLSTHKICVIDDAERLTVGAANALLKIMEDPPGHSLFILVTHQPFRLLPTVRSRCVTVRFSSATSVECEGALALKRQMAPDDAAFLSRMAGNRIGAAMRMDLDHLHAQHDRFPQYCQPGDALAHPTAVLQQADMLLKGQRPPDVEDAQWKSRQFHDTLDWMAHGLRDLLLLNIGASHDLIMHHTRIAQLQSCADALDPADLVELLDALYALEQAAARNLNLQLCLENFLFHVHRVVHRHAA